MNLKQVGYESMNQIHLAQDTAQWRALVNIVMNMAIFWVVAPCGLVEVYQRFRGPCCLHPRRYNPEDLKSYTVLNLRVPQKADNFLTS
jgi:hypothetical protein